MTAKPWRFNGRDCLSIAFPYTVSVVWVTRGRSRVVVFPSLEGRRSLQVWFLERQVPVVVILGWSQVRSHHELCRKIGSKWVLQWVFVKGMHVLQNRMRCVESVGLRISGNFREGRIIQVCCQCSERLDKQTSAKYEGLRVSLMSHYKRSIKKKNFKHLRFS